jgi:8-oxo-dGTP pyrophosphatase MutT (NUDIX family)
MTQQRGPWTVLAKRTTYDNRWIRVTHHDVVTPAGETGIYGTVHHKHLAIGVVPIDEEGYTYMVGQYRFALERYSWEIPEGGGEHGTDPRISAARELREETGLSANHWQSLVEMDLSNSVSDERGIVFLAWGLTQGESSPDPTEELTINRIPMTEAFTLVASGHVRDALSIMGIQAVQLLHLSGRLPIKIV